jgi:hypothetical protein
MAQRIVVHIGAMKSATTYLQNLCDVNMTTLAAAGVYWPGSRAIFSATTRAHRPSDADWPSLVAAVRRHDGLALISNELLSLRRPKRIRAFVDDLGDNVHIVVTARDLARVIPSQWHTGTRNRRQTPPWPDFVAALMRDDPDDPAVDWFWRRHDLPQLLGAWTSHVGATALTVVTVPPPGAATELIAARFMSVLGVDVADLAPPTWRSPTYGIVTSELIRRLSTRLEHLSDEQYRAFLTQALARGMVADPQPPEPRVTLTDPQLQWARDRATRIVEAVAASGVSVVGDLADLIPSESTVGVPTPRPTDAELLDAALRALEVVGTAWPVGETQPTTDPNL